MKNSQRDYHRFITLYSQFKNNELQGRYITYAHIENSLERLKHGFEVKEVEKSTLGIPIPSITVGNGKIKVLAWSQMHGNESTTTKAVFDLLNAFNIYKNDPFIRELLSKVTFKVIPMLNPDGARAYTRVNANNVDLNRDANLLKEKESKLLRKEFDDYQPHFCFNLHDQRTIFSAGENSLPATMSFLTPAMDPGRAITPSREKSMKVIAAINDNLQDKIPGQTGRYSDAYNINCTGDTFQTFNVPTILFEAGHFKNDYNREKTREFVTYSLLSGLEAIAAERWKYYTTEEYMNIPENQQLFYDVILRNASVNGSIVDIAIQFREELKSNQIEFVPVIQKIDPSLAFFAHKEMNCKEIEVTNENSEILVENVVVRNVLLKNELLFINNINN